MVPNETKKLVRGEFGQTVRPMKESVVKKILKAGEERITDRPADHIPPQMEKFIEESAPWAEQPEDALSYALFPQVAEEFFKYRRAQQTGLSAMAMDKKNKAYPL
jgi:oxaloacetate decarboxylase alpha subunit